jgi:hypothetical protein
MAGCGLRRVEFHVGVIYVQFCSSLCALVSIVCPPYWSVGSSTSYNSGLSLRRMLYWFVCIGVLLIIFLIFIHVFFSFYNYTAVIVLKFPYFSYVVIIQITAPSRTLETQGFFEFRCIPAMFRVFVSPRFGISDTGGIQPWGGIWNRDQRNKYLFWGGAQWVRWLW